MGIPDSSNMESENSNFQPDPAICLLYGLARVILRILPFIIAWPIAKFKFTTLANLAGAWKIRDVTWRIESRKQAKLNLFYNCILKY